MSTFKDSRGNIVHRLPGLDSISTVEVGTFDVVFDLGAAATNPFTVIFDYIKHGRVVFLNESTGNPHTTTPDSAASFNSSADIPPHLRPKNNRVWPTFTQENGSINQEHPSCWSVNAAGTMNLNYRYDFTANWPTTANTGIQGFPGIAYITA